MTIAMSGPISARDIRTEFGGGNNLPLSTSSYYRIDGLDAADRMPGQVPSTMTMTGTGGAVTPPEPNLVGTFAAGGFTFDTTALDEEIFPSNAFTFAEGENTWSVTSASGTAFDIGSDTLAGNALCFTNDLSYVIDIDGTYQFDFEVTSLPAGGTADPTFRIYAETQLRVDNGTPTDSGGTVQFNIQSLGNWRYTGNISGTISPGDRLYVLLRETSEDSQEPFGMTPISFRIDGVVDTTMPSPSATTNDFWGRTSSTSGFPVTDSANDGSTPQNLTFWSISGSDVAINWEGAVVVNSSIDSTLGTNDITHTVEGLTYERDTTSFYTNSDNGTVYYAVRRYIDSAGGGTAGFPTTGGFALVGFDEVSPDSDENNSFPISEPDSVGGVAYIGFSSTPRSIDLSFSGETFTFDVTAAEPRVFPSNTPTFEVGGDVWSVTAATGDTFSQQYDTNGLTLTNISDAAISFGPGDFEFEVEILSLPPSGEINPVVRVVRGNNDTNDTAYETDEIRDSNGQVVSTITSTGIYTLFVPHPRSIFSANAGGSVRVSMLETNVDVDEPFDMIPISLRINNLGVISETITGTGVAIQPGGGVGGTTTSDRFILNNSGADIVFAGGRWDFDFTYSNSSASDIESDMNVRFTAGDGSTGTIQNESTNNFDFLANQTNATITVNHTNINYTWPDGQAIRLYINHNAGGNQQNLDYTLDAMRFSFSNTEFVEETGGESNGFLVNVSNGPYTTLDSALESLGSIGAQTGASVGYGSASWSFTPGDGDPFWQTADITTKAAYVENTSGQTIDLGDATMRAEIEVSGTLPADGNTSPFVRTYIVNPGDSIGSPLHSVETAVSAVGTYDVQQVGSLLTATTVENGGRVYFIFREVNSADWPTTIRINSIQMSLDGTVLEPSGQVVTQINQNVPTSGPISTADFYGATNGES